MNLLKKKGAYIMSKIRQRQMFKSKRTSYMPYVRSIQNFRLVWLDMNINENKDKDSINTIKNLHKIVTTIDRFTDVDECIDFITTIEDEKIFLITSGSVGQGIIPIIYDIVQIDRIYIFCRDEVRHKQWANKCPKVDGVYTDIRLICQKLKKAARQCDRHSISFNLVKANGTASNQNLHTLDSSFMYTQILKEILLTIDFEQVHIDEFLTYCREQIGGDQAQLKIINKIEREYRNYQPIWWYADNNVFFSILNRALRLMELDVIIKMGFFLKDLHNDINKLHIEQYSGHHNSKPFTVYRGQALSKESFDELRRTQDGLISFNNFLSTSLDRNVSLAFAESIQSTSDMIGILFQISINPSTTPSPFAKIKDVSNYKDEEEILFSMHSIFRIGQIKQMKGYDRLWQVDLTLTSDNDQQLLCLTKRIREETFPHLKGWYRLGYLLIQLGQVDIAEHVVNSLLVHKPNDSDKESIYFMLGMIRNDQGQFPDAIDNYQKSMKIRKEISSPNDTFLVALYNGLGTTYHNMAEYSNALEYYNKAFEICQNSPPDLATSYGNIGRVYLNIGQYLKALSCYQKALDIQQKTLPENHPYFIESYNEIGLVHSIMKNYSEALASHKKALDIAKKIRPSNHPDLVTCYNNIGLTYNHMHEYKTALSYYEKAHDILKNSLHSNHPDLATSYSNIGSVYKSLKDYSNALSCYHKALEIDQETLPANHPDLATAYNNIGRVYENINDNNKALTYFQHAFNILQKCDSPNHPHLKSVRTSIETIKQRLSY